MLRSAGEKREGSALPKNGQAEALYPLMEASSNEKMTGKIPSRLKSGLKKEGKERGFLSQDKAMSSGKGKRGLSQWRERICLFIKKIGKNT